MFFTVIVIALIIASLYVWSLYRSMNNVVNQKQANVYIVEDSFVVHNTKDVFLYSNVTKIARPKNNNHGGSRGGGPGGGGPRGGGPRGGGSRGGGSRGGGSRGGRR